jgi:hypothetical protein
VEPALGLGVKSGIQESNISTRRVPVLKQMRAAAILVLVMASAAHAIVMVEETEIDLGYTYRDEPRKMVFEIRNAASDTLRIYGVEPSCDCTTAEVVPEAIGPDETGRVLVFFDPMGYEGRGRFQEYVRLYTSDPQDSEIMLKFWVEIGIGPEPEPRALQFGSLCKDESDTMSISIVPPPDAELRIADARSDTACVSVERVGTGEAGRQEFRVIACNVEGCGRIATFLTFETSDTLRPQIRVPVSVSMMGSFIAEPDIVAFGPTLPGSYVSQVVKILSPRGKRFTAPAVTTTIEGLHPEIAMTGDTCCELRLKIAEDAPPGQVSGSVLVETDCPDEPPVEIKVNGYIRKG